VDLAANAESLGVTVLRAESLTHFRELLVQARSVSGPVMVHVQADPMVPAPSSESWWDVSVAQVSTQPATSEAYERYLTHKANQRPLI
jgi:3D-(3,5/4)-trihydroxycyclohexane-1,2-dione acylhydrolase (decyclizing)